MIEVYHLNDEAFFPEDNMKETVVLDSSKVDPRYYNANIGFDAERQSKAVIELFNEGYYVLVAKVNTNSLDHAWSQTNHIEESWLENQDVQAMVEAARSSKVGDVMKDESGKYHIVASIGFKEIPDGEIAEKKKTIKP